MENDLFDKLIKAIDDDIEILDNKKIEKIEIDNDRIKAPSTGNYAYSISQPQKIIITKLNELIDKINKIKEE